MNNHWNHKYNTTEQQLLGWYEEHPEPSLTMINECSVNKNDTIIDIGCGTSILIDELVKLEYTNIVAIDISQSALDILKNRIQTSYPNLSNNVNFLLEFGYKLIELIDLCGYSYFKLFTGFLVATLNDW